MYDSQEHPFVELEDLQALLDETVEEGVRQPVDFERRTRQTMVTDYEEEVQRLIDEHEPGRIDNLGEGWIVTHRDEHVYVSWRKEL